MYTPSENCRTVLVVDHDPSVLVLLQNILTAAGYRVLLARERADAYRLAWQKHVPIDLALLDIHVAGPSEAEFAQEILAIRPEIRILRMSGFVDGEFVRIKLVEGFTGSARQPLPLDNFLAGVRQSMEAEPDHSQAASAGQRTFASGAAAHWE